MKKLSNRKAKQRSKPWITNGIKAAIKVKNKLYETGDKVKKSNFVIFHPYQKQLASQPKLSMFDDEKNIYIRL